jgi:hypothetical protein
MKKYEQDAITASSLTQMPEDWKLGFVEGFQQGYRQAREEALRLVSHPIRPVYQYGDTMTVVTQAMADKIKHLGESDNEDPPEQAA